MSKTTTKIYKWVVFVLILGILYSGPSQLSPAIHEKFQEQIDKQLFVLMADLETKYEEQSKEQWEQIQAYLSFASWRS